MGPKPTRVRRAQRGQNRMKQATGSIPVNSTNKANNLQALGAQSEGTGGAIQGALCTVEPPGYLRFTKRCIVSGTEN